MLPILPDNLRANRKYRIFLPPVLLYFSRKVGRLKRSILQHRCGFHRDVQALPPGLTGTSLLQSSSRPTGQTRKSKSSQPPGITWNTGNSQTGSSAQTRGWPRVAGSLRRGRTWSRSGLVQRMALLRWLILLAPWGVAGAELGKFWHISDLHLDPNYTVSKDPLQVCPSAGSQPVPNAGPWGDYLCDSPWVLVNSSIYAMKEIEPKPDFILWTGDDTPHVPNEQLGEAAVVAIVECLTNLIREAFPDTKVYAALGNHDFHPKNQFPAESNSIYNQVAELWRPWFNNESFAVFREGAFYSEKLPGPSRAGRVVVLNTNLYYSSNEQTAGMADPSQQFQWLGDVLSNASRDGEMVYIIGHVPPGFFEKTQDKAWFRESFNEEYLKVVQKHHRVIAGQFFGHHHTDSFRMFYDDAGAPIGVMFLTPGVTPWKTTLPGVVNGANNPGIRVFEYDRVTLKLQDMVTYFLNLSQANTQGTPRWELEYRLTEAYQVQDAGTNSMHTALTRIASDQHMLQRYYIYNSVSYDHSTCGDICRAEHVCAMQQVAFNTYATCLHGLGSKLVPSFLLMLTLLPSLSVLVVP